MHHPPPRWYRALIGVWSLWFTVVLTAPAVLPPCPTHGGHAGHQAALPMQHMHRNATPASDEHHKSGLCTCPGPCCCAGPVAVPAVQRDLRGQTIRQDTCPSWYDASAPRVLWAHAHPFATAPPAA